MLQQIGETISKFRKDRNMTQEDFAQRLGVTPQAVSKWERGVSVPDIALAADICRLLEVRADVLLGIDALPYCENKDTVAEREIKQNLIAEPLCIEIGIGLIPCITQGLQTDYVNQCRKKLAAGTGMLLPLIRIRDAENLKENEVRIVSYDRILQQQEYAKTDVQTYYRIIDEAVRLCRENYAKVLNKHLVKRMLDNLQEQYPGVLDGLVPDRVGYYGVMEYLKKTVEEKGDIRDLIHIIEELERTL